MAPRIIIAAILLIAWIFAPDFIAALSLPVFVLSIISIGMLHGGLDHVTAFEHFKMQPDKKKWFLFLAGYMGIIIVYGLLWLISPTTGLILFILMSCYHFGQLDMHAISEAGWAKAVYLSRGIYLIGLMIVGQAEQVQLIIDPITASADFTDVLVEWRFVLIGILVAQHILLLAVGTRDISAHTVTDTIATGLMFIFLPPLLSFGLYFALWHSWDHLQLLNRYLKLPNWKALLFQALPFTVMALMGIAGIILIFRQSLSEPGTVMYVLIGISLLTMPHMLLVDRVVEHDHT